jgi:hypothetical protein
LLGRGNSGAAPRPCGGALEYRATTAQWHSDRRARRGKIATFAANDTLWRCVGDSLAGTIMVPMALCRGGTQLMAVVLPDA